MGGYNGSFIGYGIYVPTAYQAYDRMGDENFDRWVKKHHGMTDRLGSSIDSVVFFHPDYYHSTITSRTSMYYDETCTIDRINTPMLVPVGDVSEWRDRIMSMVKKVLGPDVIVKEGYYIGYYLGS